MQASQLSGYESNLISAFLSALGSTVSLSVTVQDGIVTWTSGDASIQNVDPSALQASLAADEDLARILGYTCK